MRLEYFYEALSNEDINPIKIDESKNLDNIKITDHIRASVYHDEEIKSIVVISSMQIDSTLHYQMTMKLIDIAVRLTTELSRTAREELYTRILKEPRGVLRHNLSSVEHELNHKWIKLTVATL